MAEGVFSRPLKQLLHAFPEDLMSILRFSGEKERFPSWIDGSAPPDRVKEAGYESPKAFFLERMR
jgi:hypothetical protein